MTTDPLGTRSATELPEFTRVGPYRLVQQLGEGGMGVVHLALDRAGRAVAIKVLRPHVAVDPAARTRLRREVETLSRIRHPNVAPILDHDVTGDLPYVVTRYIAGPALDDVVEDNGPLRGAALLQLGRGLAGALHAIHEAGVIHRDVKPGNVLVLDGEPVLIDFGIAHVADDIRLTRTGLVMGTPGYLSPEIVEGGEVSTSTDWWGWAATLAFAASGRPPFGRGSMESVLTRVVRGEANLTGIDPALVPLLDAALSPYPEDRPTDTEVLRALERYAEGGVVTDVLRATPRRDGSPATQAIEADPTAVLPAVPAGPAPQAQRPAVAPAPPRQGASVYEGGQPQPPHSQHGQPGQGQARQVPAAPGQAGQDRAAEGRPGARGWFGRRASTAPPAPATAAPAPGALAPGVGYDRTGDPTYGADPRPAPGYPNSPDYRTPGYGPAATNSPPGWAGTAYGPGEGERPLPPRPAMAGDPRIGRAGRAAVLAGIAGVLIATAACYPAAAVIGALLWSVLARAADRSVTSLVLRRHSKGARSSDLALSVLASPVHLLSGMVATIAAALIPAAVGLAGVFASLLAFRMLDTISAHAEYAAALAVGMALMVMMSWWGPGGAGLRRGSRSLARGLAPGELANQIVVGLLLAGTAAMVTWSVVHPGLPAWWPWTDAPAVFDSLTPPP